MLVLVQKLQCSSVFMCPRKRDGWLHYSYHRAGTEEEGENNTALEGSGREIDSYPFPCAVTGIKLFVVAVVVVNKKERLKLQSQA